MSHKWVVLFWDLPRLQFLVACCTLQAIKNWSWRRPGNELRPGGSKIKLDWPVRNCVCKHAAASGVLWGHATPPQTFSNLMLWDRFWGHFWTLFQPYLQLLAGFNNAMISLLRNHVVLASFPDPSNTKFTQPCKQKVGLAMAWATGPAPPALAPAAPMHAHIQTSALDTSIHRVVTVV